MAVRSPTSTPLVPIRSGPRSRVILVLAMIAGVVGLLAYVRGRFADPEGLVGVSPSGWMVLVLLAVLLAMTVAAFRKLGPAWGVALVAQALAAVVLVGLLSHSPTRPDAKPAVRPAHRQAADLAAGCPALGKDPVGFVRCAWSHATAATNKRLAPTTTTIPRSR